MHKYTFTFFIVLLLISGVCHARERVMIVANKSPAAGALSTRHPAVSAAVQRVASVLVDKSIGVFDEATMEKVRGRIERAAGIDVDIPDNDLIAMALKNSAAVLVKLELFAVTGPKNAKDVSIRATAKMYEVASAKLLALSQQNGTNMLPNPDAKDLALAAASSKAGFRIGKRLYEKLSQNHPAVLQALSRDLDIPAYVFVFKGYSEPENDLILNVLYDRMELDSHAIKELNVTPGYLETELFFSDKFGRMVRKLKRISREKGMEMTEISRDTRRVILTNKNKVSKSNYVLIE
ncbi:MAG: hypothetical protein V6Z89_20815 [Desulfobacter sp.]